MSKITLETASGHVVTVEASARDTGIWVHAKGSDGEDQMTFLTATELRAYVLTSQPITK